MNGDFILMGGLCFLLFCCFVVVVLLFCCFVVLFMVQFSFFVKNLLSWDHSSEKFKKWKWKWGWINKEDEGENEEEDSREEFITEFLEIGMVTKKVNGVVGELKADTKMDAIFGLANNSVTLLMEKYKCKDRAYHSFIIFLCSMRSIWYAIPLVMVTTLLLKEKR